MATPTKAQQDRYRKDPTGKLCACQAEPAVRWKDGAWQGKICMERATNRFSKPAKRKVERYFAPEPHRVGWMQ